MYPKSWFLDTNCSIFTQNEHIGYFDQYLLNHPKGF